MNSILILKLKRSLVREAYHQEAIAAAVFDTARLAFVQFSFNTKLMLFDPCEFKRQD